MVITRRKFDLHTYFCNTVLFQKSVVNMGIKLLTLLPERIKKMDDFKLFKKELKSLLFSNSFYTIDEFLKLNKVFL
jgi:hypothetical protein